MQFHSLTCNYFAVGCCSPFPDFFFHIACRSYYFLTFFFLGGQFRFCLVQPIFWFEMVGWARQCLVWFSRNACGCNNFVCTFLQELASDFTQSKQ